MGEERRSAFPLFWSLPRPQFYVGILPWARVQVAVGTRTGDLPLWHLGDGWDEGGREQAREAVSQGSPVCSALCPSRALDEPGVPWNPGSEGSLFLGR